MRSNNSMCAWIVHLVVKATWGGEGWETKGVRPPVGEGKYSLHHQCSHCIMGALRCLHSGKRRVWRPLGGLHKGTITAWKQVVCVCAHVGAVKKESLVWKECYKLYVCVCVRTDVTGVRKKTRNVEKK